MEVPPITLADKTLFEAENNHEEVIRLLRDNRILLTRIKDSMRRLEEMKESNDDSNLADINKALTKLHLSQFRLRLERARYLTLFNQTYDDLQMVRTFIEQEESSS